MAKMGYQEMEERIQALQKEVLERRRTEAELREQLSDLNAKNATLVKQMADFAHVRKDLEEKRDELELFRTDLERAMDALVESQVALRKAKEAADSANRSKAEFLAKMHAFRLEEQLLLYMPPPPQSPKAQLEALLLKVQRVNSELLASLKMPPPHPPLMLRRPDCHR